MAGPAGSAMTKAQKRERARKRFDAERKQRRRRRASRPPGRRRARHRSTGRPSRRPSWGAASRCTSRRTAWPSSGSRAPSASGSPSSSRRPRLRPAEAFLFPLGLLPALADLASHHDIADVAVFQRHLHDIAADRDPAAQQKLTAKEVLGKDDELTAMRRVQTLAAKGENEQEQEDKAKEKGDDCVKIESEQNSPATVETSGSRGIAGTDTSIVVNPDVKDHPVTQPQASDPRHLVNSIPESTATAQHA